jgi:hypothetical protein
MKNGPSGRPELGIRAHLLQTRPAPGAAEWSVPNGGIAADGAAEATLLDLNSEYGQR